jgi:putative transposase
MKYRKQTNCVYGCEYHIVLPTKYRRQVFNEGSFAFLEEVLKGLKDGYPEIDILEINHDVDHIHMLVVIPPKYSVGRIVGMIKANSSREMLKKFEYIRKIYWGVRGIWSEGYFVSTVGINEGIIQSYIQKQGEEDLGQTQFALR